jgi:hypothetical protein
MRFILITMLAAGSIGLLSPFGASAADVDAAAATSPVAKARIACYRGYKNSNQRVFVHWGPCDRRGRWIGPARLRPS